MARERRLRQTVRDMVLSMAVIAVPIALVLLIEPSAPGTAVRPVAAADYQSALTAARQVEPFTVVTPSGLPSTWEQTSASYNPPGNTAALWQVGYVAPGGGFAEFEQTSASIGGFLSDQGSDATQFAAQDVDGTVWTEYTGDNPPALRTLLERTVGTSTEIVAGDTSMANLLTLAGSLH
jgi:Protein of unknown function (DUF4245)